MSYFKVKDPKTGETLMDTRYEEIHLETDLFITEFEKIRDRFKLVERERGIAEGIMESAINQDLDELTF